MVPLLKSQALHQMMVTTPLGCVAKTFLIQCTLIPTPFRLPWLRPPIDIQDSMLHLRQLLMKYVSAFEFSDGLP